MMMMMMILMMMTMMLIMVIMSTISTSQNRILEVLNPSFIDDEPVHVIVHFCYDIFLICESNNLRCNSHLPT